MDSWRQGQWRSGDVRKQKHAIVDFLRESGAPGVAIQQRIADACKRIDLAALGELLIEAQDSGVADGGGTGDAGEGTAVARLLNTPTQGLDRRAQGQVSTHSTVILA